MELEDVDFARGGAPDAGSLRKRKESKESQDFCKFCICAGICVWKFRKRLRKKNTVGCSKSKCNCFV